MEPFIASSLADPVAVLIPIDIAVMGEHVAFYQCCPRLNLKAAWTLWNPLSCIPLRQNGILEVQHEVIAMAIIANVEALVTWSARHV